MVRVLVTGGFDIIHPGHIFLLNSAAKLGVVIVILGADVNIEKFKGQPPIVPQEQRLAVIQALKPVKEAYIGQAGNRYLDFALSKNIDIIYLGPDQKISENQLQRGLAKRGQTDIRIVRCEKYLTQYPLTSSSKIKEKIKTTYVLDKESH